MTLTSKWKGVVCVCVCLHVCSIIRTKSRAPELRIGGYRYDFAIPSERYHSMKSFVFR